MIATRHFFVFLLASLSAVACGDDDGENNVPDDDTGSADSGSGDTGGDATTDAATDSGSGDDAASDVTSDVADDAVTDTDADAVSDTSATDAVDDTTADVATDTSEGSGDTTTDAGDGPANCVGYEWCLIGDFTVTEDQESFGSYENTDAFDTIIEERVYFSVGFNVGNMLQGSPPMQGRTITHEFESYSFAFSAASSDLWNNEFHPRVSRAAPTLAIYAGLSNPPGISGPIFTGRHEGFQYSIGFFDATTPPWEVDESSYPILAPFDPTTTTVEIRRAMVEEDSSVTTTDAGYGTASLSLIRGTAP